MVSVFACAVVPCANFQCLSEGGRSSGSALGVCREGGGSSPGIGGPPPIPSNTGRDFPSTCSSTGGGAHCCRCVWFLRVTFWGLGQNGRDLHPTHRYRGGGGVAERSKTKHSLGIILSHEMIILEGVRHLILCIGVCYPNDPKKQGLYGARACAPSNNFAFRDDFFFGALGSMDFWGNTVPMLRFVEVLYFCVAACYLMAYLPLHNLHTLSRRISTSTNAIGTATATATATMAIAIIVTITVVTV